MTIIRLSMVTNGAERVLLCGCLQKAGVLRTSFTPETLTTLTLLAEESKPKDRGKIIGLVLFLLGKDYE